MGPGAYFATGVIAFGIKYSLDRVAAELLVHRAWKPWEYLSPVVTATNLLSLGAADRRFLLAMSAIALPFIWLGISVTMKRLRSAGLPLWLVALFFVPMASLVFFLLLSVLPARTGAAPRENGDAMPALVCGTLICLGAAWFGTSHVARYGLGLFVALPFCVGMMTTLIYTARNPHTYSQCVLVSLAAVAVAGLGFLALGLEGLLCLLMAAPIACPLAWLGATVGYWMTQPRRPRAQTIALVVLAALAPPAVMAAESQPAPEFAVTSAIEVNAPPEVVWSHVISFSELPEPSEWLFRAGIAYPVRAEIHGRGAGAVRYCVFSTGPFVEPITVWEEARRLEFGVTRVPAPMHEWSPYPGLHPPHLDGYFVSHRGRFLLTSLADGRTRLEGTTWYANQMWPAAYWQVWSDEIVHRIHLRVLRHIQELAEK